MNTLILLTAPDCHLCAHGREVLDSLAADGLIRWRELDADSDEGSRLAAATPPLRPVLLDASGTVLAYGRLSRRRLARDLARARPGGRARDLARARPPASRRGHPRPVLR
jgi:hypothetical protein